MSVDDRLRAVIAAVFGVDSATLKDSDSPKTIGAWDSVAHLELIFALEAEFGVQFSADEIATLTSVGVIRDRIQALSA
jgi:acyl carrier protein